MTDILVRPQELRQTVQQLRASAKKISGATGSVGKVVLGSALRLVFTGNRASALMRRYLSKAGELAAFDDLVVKFANDLEQAANRFEQADRSGSLSSANSSGVGPNSSGNLLVGKPVRPDIYHDNGFSGYCSKNPNNSACSTEPSVDDYLNRTKYEALLRGAQALGHLDNGIKAYEHYLYGNGKDFHYSYSEFVNEDHNGRIAFNNILVDVQKNVEVLAQGRDEFSITSKSYAIGGDDPRYPYPSTENWQKAIGAHHVWVSADVKTSVDDLGNKVYTMEITYNAEDRYNFNPGAADIATGSLDRDNGRFEVLGWAHPFMSYGQTTTAVSWVEGDIANSQVSQSLTDRLSERSNDRRPDRPDE